MWHCSHCVWLSCHYVSQNAAAQFGQPEPQIQQLSRTSKPGWSVSGKRMFLFCGVVWPEMPPQERQTNETGKFKGRLANLKKTLWKHAILAIMTSFSHISRSRQPGQKASPHFNWSNWEKHNSAFLYLAMFSKQLTSKIVARERMIWTELHNLHLVALWRQAFSLMCGCSVIYLAFTASSLPRVML